MARVNLSHLKKVYDGNVTAVYDFDIDIQDGEFIVIVGPSGCGKSTTLRAIMNLINKTDGKVFVENKEFTKAFRGYDIYEVEEFMKGLVADYEKLYRDNAELKEKGLDYLCVSSIEQLRNKQRKGL